MTKILLRELGINVDFQNNFVGWKETKIPMTSINCKFNLAVQDIINVQQIELGKFKTPNLKEITTKSKYLNSD